MLINHEVPLDLLETSKTFNDYDFVLPTFWYKYPKYKEFYLKSSKFKIGDNAAYEEGKPLDNNKLISFIDELKPNIFIVPDAWNSFSTTLDKAEEWMELKPSLPEGTELMMVLQGKNFTELQECVWQGLGLGYRHFGINHASLAYSDVFMHSNPVISKMMGRILTFNKLIEEDLKGQLSKCYIHLLGVSDPRELIYFNNKHLIKSIDTSNPILNGIKGVKYNSSKEIIGKPDEKLEFFMEKDLASNIEDIILNVNIFRKWCNGF